MIARITCLVSGEYTIFDEVNNKTLLAKPRGIFRKNSEVLKVGDIVEYSIEKPFSIIEKVYKRKNDFIRPAIANIDQAFIVTSLKEPLINENLLDRMITQFEYQNITPILVFSKIDLLNDIENKQVNKIINYYKSIGYICITTSNKIPLTIDDIKKYLPNKISVITGQSGVGKSSIINIIDDTINESTNEISKALNRGKHTTRYTRLYYTNGGYLADSPGFGSMDLTDMDEVSISHCFVEFFKASNKCKYSGCLHINEPLCEVKRLVDNNEILKTRYDNYLQFVNNAKNRRKW